jgi:hypothetical protein
VPVKLIRRKYYFLTFDAFHWFSNIKREEQVGGLLPSVGLLSGHRRHPSSFLLQISLQLAGELSDMSFLEADEL